MFILKEKKDRKSVNKLLTLRYLREKTKPNVKKKEKKKKDKKHLTAEIETEKQQRNSMKPKSGSLRRFMKLIRMFPADETERGYKWLISGITWGHPTPPMDIKGKIRKYYKQHYTNKFENLYKMDQFPEKHKLPKLTLEEIGNK